LTITINLGKGVNEAELVDSANVIALRNAIKALFPNFLATCDASNLVVWTTDATGKLRLLENAKGKLGDELGEDGNFEVWVEVPKAAAGFTTCPFGLNSSLLVGLESACILLDPKSGAPLPPDVPLELHQIVGVS